MSVISIEREAAHDLVRRYSLTASDLVIEVGSGCGTFLSAVHESGVRVLGLEPNMRSMAEAWASGIDTLAVHFSNGTAEYILEKYGPAKLLVSRNVRPGTDTFTRLVSSASRCLTAEGVIAILGTGVNAVLEVRPDQPLRQAA